ncbi:class I SAM-dependent methyltransferase [Actinomycetospora sp. C-140]
MVLEGEIADLRANGHYKHAWSGYKEMILRAASSYDAPRMLEVGGGRSPSLTEDQVRRLGADYTVNDIDREELSLAPKWTSQLLGDIADPGLTARSEALERYDLIFSHMVFEHVTSPASGYRNVARMLAPGGLLINFIPTLFALPFVVNRLLPERASHEILRRAFPKRDLRSAPKFPAYYRWCNTLEPTCRKIEAQGFKEVSIVPFYGHDYYRKFQPLQALEEKWWPIASRLQIRPASTFAYVIAEGA